MRVIKWSIWNRYKEVKQNIQLTSVANNKERKSLARSWEKREKKKSIKSKTKEEPFHYRWLHWNIIHSHWGCILWRQNKFHDASSPLEKNITFNMIRPRMKSSEKITCIFLQILQEQIGTRAITLRKEGSNNLYSYHKGTYRKQKSTANQKEEQLDGWRRNILGNGGLLLVEICWKNNSKVR